MISLLMNTCLIFTLTLIMTHFTLVDSVVAQTNGDQSFPVVNTNGAILNHTGDTHCNTGDISNDAYAMLTNADAMLTNADAVLNNADVMLNNADVMLNNADDIDLLSINIENLMDMQVTSVGKKQQVLSSSAAAIHVITAEDIKHSGVTSIADALKLVPGLHVARLNSDKWAINSRDLGSRFAETLLVLIDGRSVYTPSFSGVYWEVQDTLLADIDRIEVIRGPGATLWGANAVNGVINIITKSSKETQGGLVEAGAGDLEHRFGSVRYGTAITDNVNARIFCKGFDRESLTHPDGSESTRGWESFRGGFRMDADITSQDLWTLQGELYSGDIYQCMKELPILPVSDFMVEETPSTGYSFAIEDHSEVSGGHIQMAWQKILSSSSEWDLQLYYDRMYRKELFITEERESVDLEFEHRFSPMSRHDVVWGLRCNHTWDHFDDTLMMSAVHDSDRNTLFSLFVQDEFLLIPDTLWLTLGTKLEHNEVTGSEILPGIRLFWSLSNSHKLWGAVSRAVRNPSRLERDGEAMPYLSPPFSLEMSEYPYTNYLPVVYSLSGGEWFESERLLSWEAGYRFIASSSFFADISLYYNRYNNSRSFEVDELIIHDDWIEQKIRFVNGPSWQTWGGELSLAWNPLDWLKLDMAYSFLRRQLNSEAEVSSKAPNHQFSLQGTLSPLDSINFHCRLKYVDDSSQVLWSAPPDFLYDIDAYTTLDFAVIWKATSHIDISLSVQNLLDEAHVEAVQEVWIPPEEVRRSIYGKVTCSF
ncbi:TonB-dependent receptor [Desulfamplus magnetovallimortis]|uniref:TonB-dependent receptor n=1 Tax=Desulfamplus magnetovallimortis TaxID=1246637 RepID=A0A1W1H8V9_9BACT|nr:TonB-dependent receptor [Desulfamplus magnetovallimortis]SLM28876.1 TonB-dependent receptor [Desulfamplus magnetovallimortis]